MCAHRIENMSLSSMCSNTREAEWANKSLYSFHLPKQWKVFAKKTYSLAPRFIQECQFFVCIKLRFSLMNFGNIMWISKSFQPLLPVRGLSISKLPVIVLRRAIKEEELDENNWKSDIAIGQQATTRINSNR